jgi:hypothetical protein
MARSYTKTEDKALAHVLDVLLKARLYDNEAREAVLLLAGALGELSAFRFMDILEDSKTA